MMKPARELSFKQFQAALKRDGFRHVALFWFEDTTGATPGHSFPGVFLRNGKHLRRATIAQLRRQRRNAIEIAEREKGASP